MTQEGIDDLMFRRVNRKSQMGDTSNPNLSFYLMGKYAKLTIMNSRSPTSYHNGFLEQILEGGGREREAGPTHLFCTHLASTSGYGYE